MGKMLRVTMPDNSKWDVPASLIDADRNAYYRSREDDYVDEESDDYDLEDWAANNMNWTDVSAHAICVVPSTCDFEEGWANGDKEIVNG